MSRERPDRLAVVARAVRLGAVLDHEQAARLGERGDLASSAPGRPNTCTGMIARVRGVIAFSIASSEMHQVSGSTSTSTGRAPTWMHGVGRRREGEVRHDDLVALADAERGERQVQRHGAVARWRRHGSMPTLSAKSLLEGAHVVADRGNPGRQVGIDQVAQLRHAKGRARRRARSLASGRTRTSTMRLLSSRIGVSGAALLVRIPQATATSPSRSEAEMRTLADRRPQMVERWQRPIRAPARVGHEHDAIARCRAHARCPPRAPVAVAADEARDILGLAAGPGTCVASSCMTCGPAMAHDTCATGRSGSCDVSSGIVEHDRRAIALHAERHVLRSAHGLPCTAALPVGRDEHQQEAAAARAQQLAAERAGLAGRPRSSRRWSRWRRSRRACACPSRPGAAGRRDRASGRDGSSRMRSPSLTIS